MFKINKSVFVLLRQALPLPFWLWTAWISAFLWIYLLLHVLNNFAWGLFWVSINDFIKVRMNLGSFLSVDCHIAHLLTLNKIINDKIWLKPFWNVLFFYLLLNETFLVVIVVNFHGIIFLFNFTLDMVFLSFSQHKFQILRVIVIFIHTDMSFLIVLFLQWISLSQIYWMLIFVNLVKNIYQIIVQYSLVAAFLILRLFLSNNAEIIGFKKRLI